MKQDGEIIEKFLSSMGAIQILRNRAWFSACFVEYILLSTSLVDALLRWGLFIKGSINPRWLVKDFKEREIIQRARNADILDEAFSAKLHELYTHRNAIVHHFFITDIDYEFSKRVAGSYEPSIQKLAAILHEIEKKELPAISEKVVPAGKLQEADRKFQILVQRKIGDDLAKINKVRWHKWTDAEDVIAFAHRRGFFAKCKKCRHQKIEHIHIDDRAKTYSLLNCRDAKCKCKKFLK